MIGYLLAYRIDESLAKKFLRRKLIRYRLTVIGYLKQDSRLQKPKNPQSEPKESTCRYLGKVSQERKVLCHKANIS